MIRSYIHTTTAMDCVVAIEVVADDSNVTHVNDAMRRAADWFAQVNDRCSRFNAASELRQLCEQAAFAPTGTSPLLFQAISFAVEVASATDGAFDPTIGAAMERKGFDRDWQSGTRDRSGVDTATMVSYRDVILNAAAQSVTLRQRLILDLGAVAKGLAIDLAARELEAFDNFSINAGGDLYVRGANALGEPWTIGIRHPRSTDQIIAAVRLTDGAVCTSGDYERHAGGGHHLIDPGGGESSSALASVTVLAPTAMAADALATAAFVLGPAGGLRFLEAQGVEGLLVTPGLEQIATAGWTSE